MLIKFIIYEKFYLISSIWNASFLCNLYSLSPLYSKFWFENSKYLNKWNSLLKPPRNVIENRIARQTFTFTKLRFTILMENSLFTLLIICYYRMIYSNLGQYGELSTVIEGECYGSYYLSFFLSPSILPFFIRIHASSYMFWAINRMGGNERSIYAILRYKIFTMFDLYEGIDVSTWSLFLNMACMTNGMKVKWP